MPDGIRVVYLDDDEQLTTLAERLLEHEEPALEVVTETDPAAAFERLDDVDCVVSDYDMPELDGIEFLERVRASYPDLPFVLFTAKGSEEVAADAVAAGATDYIQKGTDSSQFTVLANSIVTAVERHRAERRAGEQAARFRALAENAAVGIVTIDEDSEIRFANDALGDLFGYDPEDLIGESLTTLMPEDHRDRHLDAVGTYLETGERSVDWRNAVFPARHASGEQFPIAISFSEFETADGHRFAGVVRDRREEAVPGVGRDDALDRISDAFFALDTEWRITYLNERAEAVVRERLEQDPDSILGQRYWDVVPESEANVLGERYREAMETQEPITTEAESTVTGGWVEVRVYPSESGLSVFFRDITDRKERQQELERKNERLEEFASVVSHDLRNPLQVARGYVDILAERTDGTTADHVGKVSDALDRMGDIVGSLLTLAQEGDLVGDTSPVDVGTLARAAWDGVETGGATLTVAESPTLPADADRLRQLFENLFRNAAEHAGEDGGGDLTVTVGGLDGGFYVADDGPGIPEGERAAVFESGYTTDDAGTGFGLAIVRAIARGHGWSVSVAEGEDGGARFEFRT